METYNVKYRLRYGNTEPRELIASIVRHNGGKLTKPVARKIVEKRLHPTGAVTILAIERVEMEETNAQT